MMRLVASCETFLFALTVLLPLNIAVAAENKCPDHPELLATAKPSKEQQKRLRELRAVGSVAITINEEGEVVETRVVSAPSREAGIELAKLAQAMKFRPRPGCGVFRTVVNFGPK